MRNRFDLYNIIKGPVKIFISYSHVDKKYCHALHKHLGVFMRGKMISLWYDRCINAGAEWEGQIAKEINEADLILLLISADFVNSNYCWDIELAKALERHSNGDALVIPILVSPIVGLTLTPFQHLNVIPRNKSISEFRSIDSGCIVAAKELEEVILNFSRIKQDSAKNYTWWSIRFEKTPEHFGPERVKQITNKLRELTGDVTITRVQTTGSTCLVFQSKPKSYDIIEEAHTNGQLASMLNDEILALIRPHGARIKISTEIVDKYVDYVVYENYKEPDLLSKKLQFPPFIAGFVFSLDNPISPGFLLYSDQHTSFTQTEIVDLQYRLGRYLNTFLATEQKLHTVDLSPTEEYSGLPKPLRTTEAGRDLLISDLHLKRVTCQLLHPSSSTGADFWQACKENKLMDRKELEQILRLWITPREASLNESVLDDRTVRVDLKGFSLKVECEGDYLTKRENEVKASGSDTLVEIFKEIVLPRVQEQVSAGYAFGLLRQIYSIVIVSWWYRDKFKEYKIPFIDSNNTAPYSVLGVEAEILQLHREYLMLFNYGEWKYVRNDIGGNGHVVEATKKLLVVGGISLTLNSLPHE